MFVQSWLKSYLGVRGLAVLRHHGAPLGVHLDARAVEGLICVLELEEELVDPALKQGAEETRDQRPAQCWDGGCQLGSGGQGGGVRKN